jgi:2-hydroxy-3-oxopropionate reductase
MPDRVGFVGLGIMGGPMARNLMRAGHELVLHNRTRRKAEELAAEGEAEVVDSPAEVARKGAVTNYHAPWTAGGRGGRGRRDGAPGGSR